MFFSKMFLSPPTAKAVVVLCPIELKSIRYGHADGPCAKETKEKASSLRASLGLLRRLRLFALFQVYKSLQPAAKHPHYTTTRLSAQAS